MIDNQFPISLRLITEEDNEINLPIHEEGWVSDPLLDLAYLPIDNINFQGIDIPNNCFDYLHTGTNIEVIPPNLFQRSMEMCGFPVDNMRDFRRITFLATNEINNRMIYTADPSIQGFSGGPLVLPTSERHGFMTTNHGFGGVIGVISGTFPDNTGGKLGVVCLIEW